MLKNQLKGRTSQRIHGVTCLSISQEQNLLVQFHGAWCLGYSEHWEARGFSAALRSPGVSRPLEWAIQRPSGLLHSGLAAGGHGLAFPVSETGMHISQPGANCSGSVSTHEVWALTFTKTEPTQAAPWQLSFLPGHGFNLLSSKELWLALCWCSLPAQGSWAGEEELRNQGLRARGSETEGRISPRQKGQVTISLMACPGIGWRAVWTTSNCADRG